VWFAGLKPGGYITVALSCGLEVRGFRYKKERKESVSKSRLVAHCGAALCGQAMSIAIK
jgi:hypothetical protein